MAKERQRIEIYLFDIYIYIVNVCGNAMDMTFSFNFIERTNEKWHRLNFHIVIRVTAQNPIQPISNDHQLKGQWPQHFFFMRHTVFLLTVLTDLIQLLKSFWYDFTLTEWVKTVVYTFTTEPKRIKWVRLPFPSPTSQCDEHIYDTLS